MSFLLLSVIALWSSLSYALNDSECLSTCNLILDECGPLLQNSISHSSYSDCSSYNQTLQACILNGYQNTAVDLALMTMIDLKRHFNSVIATPTPSVPPAQPTVSQSKGINLQTINLLNVEKSLTVQEGVKVTNDPVVDQGQYLGELFQDRPAINTILVTGIILILTPVAIWTIVSLLNEDLL